MVSQRIWQGSGTTFRLEWGGRLWELAADGQEPGLRPSGQSGPIWLGLAGVGARGRVDSSALCGRTLAKLELFRSRIEATYAPQGWGDLRVRASWSPCEGDAGVDLEIQVAAGSVGELKGLEILLRTRPGVDEMDGPSSAVGPTRPRVFRPRGSAGELAYVELVHADDVSHLPAPPAPTVGAETAPGAAMTALFGHDLEKGVVIRGRVRGLWLPTEGLDARLKSAESRLLEVPPPLGM
ncbi:hypothetical protein OJF2_20050 [Aquisphaera giovannonii]|uniref:Uncharacterized protein n=1 Tax=Aquisphaera giovannonii TaxID=406548 RepID=A0A5B9VYT4_9BACT|nr:hypothetical protein [Aquisphaera giovannonii]QEH33503.1 hypothetical protein OJF2_20050 [Aquisphaera giovannonii]